VGDFVGVVEEGSTRGGSRMGCLHLLRSGFKKYEFSPPMPYDMHMFQFMMTNVAQV